MTPEDQLEIINLYGKYSHRFDNGDSAGWSELFHPDGSFEIVGAGAAYQGRVALAEFATRINKRMPGMRHFASGIAVSEGADGAHGTASVIVLRMNSGGVRVMNIGDYSDEFARHEGRWVLRHRRFTSVLDARLIDAEVRLDPA